MRQSGRLKGDVQGEETPIRPCGHLHLYRFSIKITQHIFVFNWTLIRMCHRCISWIWKHSHSSGSLDLVFRCALVTLMRKIGLRNFSVHLNHPSPLDLQKTGLEIKWDWGKTPPKWIKMPPKFKVRGPKCACYIILHLLRLLWLKSNVKWMKSVDCRIKFAHITTHFSPIKVYSVDLYNQSHTFLLSLGTQRPIKGILFSVHAHWLNSESAFANSVIIINNASSTTSAEKLEVRG